MRINVPQKGTNIAHRHGLNLGLHSYEAIALSLNHLKVLCNDISEYTYKLTYIFQVYIRLIALHRLCPRHTVPKLTQDGQTMKEIWTSHEDGLKLGQQPTNSRSKYDAYRRSHDGTRTTHEGNTKMWICNKKCTRRPHEGHTMATRRRIESTMRSN